MSTATNFFAGSTHSVDCEHNKVDQRMDYAINLGGTADTLRTLRLRLAAGVDQKFRK